MAQIGRGATDVPPELRYNGPEGVALADLLGETVHVYPGKKTSHPSKTGTFVLKTPRTDGVVTQRCIGVRVEGEDSIQSVSVFNDRWINRYWGIDWKHLTRTIFERNGEKYLIRGTPWLHSPHYTCTKVGDHKHTLYAFPKQLVESAAQGSMSCPELASNNLWQLRPNSHQDMAHLPELEKVQPEKSLGCVPLTDESCSCGGKKPLCSLKNMKIEATMPGSALIRNTIAIGNQMLVADAANELQLCGQAFTHATEALSKMQPIDAANKDQQNPDQLKEEIEEITNTIQEQKLLLGVKRKALQEAEQHATKAKRHKKLMHALRHFAQAVACDMPSVASDNDID